VRPEQPLGDGLDRAVQIGASAPPRPDAAQLGEHEVERRPRHEARDVVRRLGMQVDGQRARHGLVPQHRHRAHLAPEARQHVGPLAQRRVERLEHDEAAAVVLAREVHRAEAALAEQAQQRVAADAARRRVVVSASPATAPAPAPAPPGRGTTPPRSREPVST
jgi:hypothetical protein